MPYIKEGRRAYISHGGTPANAGELNFQLTELVQDYIEAGGGESYGTFNAILGVLTAMQHEIYRRLISPYEDQKIKENGDVFPVKEVPIG